MTENKAHVDLFKRAGRDALLVHNKAFANKHGFSVKESQGFWRVYEMGVQRALCTIESDAVDVAYALAMMAAGARLP